MEKLTIKNKQSGFGLIQVVVAASLMSALSLGVAGLITNQAQQISYMEDRMSHQNLRAEVEQLVKSNIDGCNETLTGVALPTNSNERNITLKNKDGDVIFDPNDNTKNKHDKIMIDRVFVRDVDVHSGGTGSGAVEIVVNPVRMRSGGGPVDLAPVVIRQAIAMDTGTNAVTSCEGGLASDIPPCVYRDLANRVTRSSRSGSTGTLRLPTGTLAVELNIPAGSYSYTRRDKRKTCTTSARKIVVYPGETKIGGRVLAPGGIIKVATGSVGSTTYNRSNGDTVTRSVNGIIYTYNGVTIATKPTFAIGCRNSTAAAGLGASVIPPLCGYVARGTASVPGNLGFQIFKSEE